MTNPNSFGLSFGIKQLVRAFSRISVSTGESMISSAPTLLTNVSSCGFPTGLWEKARTITCLRS